MVWRLTCWWYYELYGTSQASGRPMARYPKRGIPVGSIPTPLPSLHPSPVLPIFLFAPVGNTENFSFSSISGLAAHSKDDTAATVAHTLIIGSTHIVQVVEGELPRLLIHYRP